MHVICCISSVCFFLPFQNLSFFGQMVMVVVAKVAGRFKYVEFWFCEFELAFWDNNWLVNNNSLKNLP